MLGALTGRCSLALRRPEEISGVALSATRPDTAAGLVWAKPDWAVLSCFLLVQQKMLMKNWAGIDIVTGKPTAAWIKRQACQPCSFRSGRRALFIAVAVLYSQHQQSQW